MIEYKKALWNLTLGYTLAIFIACAILTIPVVIVASQQIERGAQLVQPTGNMPTTRAQVASEGRQRLISTTLITDGVLIALGAIASYYFARRTLKPLEEAHRAQERFTADASHELRTPLAIMQTELEVGLKGAKTKAELEKIVHGSLDEIRKLSQLTESLLQLTKPNGNLGTDKVPIAETISSIIKNAQKKSSIPIQTYVTSSATIEANKMLVSQIINILLDNALKYADKEKPEVRVEATPLDGKTRIAISNNGHGISPDDLPYVFNRLYRGNNAAAIEGSGLGLALAKSIADLHGWKLNIKSNSDSGTTATIDLE